MADDLILHATFFSPLWRSGEIMRELAHDIARRGLSHRTRRQRWRGLNVDVDITVAGSAESLSELAAVLRSRLAQGGHSRVQVSIEGHPNFPVM